MIYYKIIIKKLSDVDGKKVYIKDRVLKIKYDNFSAIIEDLTKNNQFYEIYRCSIGLLYFKKVLVLSNIMNNDMIDPAMQNDIFDDGENPFEKENVVGARDIPANLPVINESGRVVGVTNSDGSISITDPDFIKEMNVKENKVMSISFKEEKSWYLHHLGMF